jgi:hypothetical protein
LNIDPSEVQVNRAEVLLQAGLYGEAEEVAADAARAMVGRGLQLDRAEAEFVRSQALLGQLRYVEAAAAAAGASVLLANQGRVPWARRAELVMLQGAPIDHLLAARCVQLAGELTSLGQLLAAAQAYAVLGRYDAKAAQVGLHGLSLRQAEVPLEHRLTALDVLARARLACGDRSGALRATRSAIDLGNRHRLLRGAADLRAAVSAQMDAIAQLGLSLRREANRAFAVLWWVDRCHDLTMTATDMTLDSIPERGDLLAELRSSQQRLRAASPDDAPALMREQARLQRRLVSADRRAGGRSHHRWQLPRDVGARLRGVVVLQYHRTGGRLGAVVVVDGRAHIVDLGSLEDIDPSVERLHRSLRQLTRGHASGVIDQRALAAVRRHAAKLEALLVPPLERKPGRDESTASAPVVVVPLSHHAGIPWSVLPSLSRRPVTVAPSLRHWLMHASDDHKPITAVALVEGVELSGATEIDALSEIWAGAGPHVIREATVDDAIDAMQNVQLLHLACHGGRRARDGRFAQLRLADGDLVSFELERLSRTPRLVSLAACEAGLLEALPGDESAGLATALFAATTATVVAPVVVVPDNYLTRDVFVDFHRLMASGAAPASALFTAQARRMDEVESVLAQSINCFGWG